MALIEICKQLHGIGLSDHSLQVVSL